MSTSIAALVGILVLLILVAALAGGVLLIVFSRRRGPGHPACGKCGYNVHGSIGSVTRCPECGADFGQAGIMPPRGKRNPFMIAGGVVLIVFSLGCLGTSLVPLLGNAIAQRTPAAQPAPTPANAAQPETEEDPEAD